VKRSAIIVFGLVLLGLGTAWAGGAEGKSGWDAWKTVVYHAINLAILLWLIVKFAGPNVKAALKGRAQRVGQEIEEAAALHSEAKSMLDEYRDKLAGFEAQATTLLDDYRAMGEAERDRIIVDANAEAERIRQEAQRVAANEVNRAKEKLEAEIIDQAIDKAEMIIENQLSEEDHHRLVTEYFGQLETSVRAE